MMIDLGEITAVMTSPVALLTVTALGGPMVGAAADRWWLRAKGRIDDAAASRRCIKALSKALRAAEPGWSRTDAWAAPRILEARRPSVRSPMTPLTSPRPSAPMPETPLQIVPESTALAAGVPARDSGPVPAAGRPDLWVSGRPSPLAAPEMPGVLQARAESASGCIVFLRPDEQLSEFLAHIRDAMLGKNPDSGRYELSLTDVQWVAAYRRWAKDHAYAVIPEGIMLKLLGYRVRDKAGIEKYRPRLKNPATGAVLRNARGTPLRETRYTIIPYTPPPKSAAGAAGVAQKSRTERLADLEQIPDDETWSEGLRRYAGGEYEVRRRVA